MKYGLLIFTLVILLTTTVYANGEAEVALQIEEITTVMQSNEIEVSNWKLYVRGEHGLVSGLQDYTDKVESLMNKESEFDWNFPTNIEKEEHWKVTGKKQHPQTTMVEQVTVLAYPSGGQYNMYIIYEVQGEQWTTSLWDSFASSFESRTQVLFSQKPEIFSTVQGFIDYSDNLHESAQRLLSDLSAEKIEQIKEETFVSVSAYNENWADHIVTNNQKMNVQVALRNSPNGLGAKTRVTIGTPIITTEY
ncbi:YwmB family TATA-box binding protein [Alkalihalobacterium bogoriense]|uniref:YwmB family TATA-box binding protein n=1 Tax=Alkalihalobacterium bogoriense TaxID=246272 RepID=UPI0006846843|nr:YwmB family TATA-box binding protein [Alkalihalobacterium bogoriense]